MGQMLKEFAALLFGLVIVSPLVYVGAYIAFAFNGTPWAPLIALFVAGISALLVIACLATAGRYRRKS